MASRTAPRLYTAKSQYWVGDILLKPARLGGHVLEEGDPFLANYPDLFEPYNPTVREYAGRGETRGTTDDR